MKLLLISNSTNFGEAYLDHCIGEMLSVLAGADRLAFVPFAAFDRSAYGATAAERFQREGVDVDVVTADERGRMTLERAVAVFVGGGNTFRLLKTLQDSGLLDVTRRRVAEGMAYMGASAGSNIAAPTIRTTNDMPIVQPRSFDALHLVPFQINPHYIDADPASSHMGETREQRLIEYVEENENPVVGIREGAWIRVDGRSAVLGGRTSARILRRDAEPEERPPGASLSDLL
ncbi:MAG: dipeptidase PepE [bacterium]|nr:dipeptidase PepE [bacterium]